MPPTAAGVAGRPAAVSRTRASAWAGLRTPAATARAATVLVGAAGVSGVAGSALMAARNACEVLSPSPGNGSSAAGAVAASSGTTRSVTCWASAVATCRRTVSPAASGRSVLATMRCPARASSTCPPCASTTRAASICPGATSSRDMDAAPSAASACMTARASAGEMACPSIRMVVGPRAPRLNRAG
ncbi:MAG: hypothetical protein U0Y82_07055 [Thermoleophilia bacterium]